MKILRFFIHLCFLLSFSFSSVQAADCPGAISLFNQGTQTPNLIQKETLFKEALSRSCADLRVTAGIHNNLGDAYENQGKLNEAVSEYKKAMELAPDLPAPYIGLGDAYSKLKDYKSAEGYYKKYGELTRFKTRGQLRSALTRSIQIKPATGNSPSPSEDLYFGFSESALTKESERQLQELLAALGHQEIKNFRFQLVGHTCSLGSDGYNQRLSENRARAVKDWLVKNGYPADQLSTTGLGKKNPVADNSTEEGRKLNRRVEIRVSSP